MACHFVELSSFQVCILTRLDSVLASFFHLSWNMAAGLVNLSCHTQRHLDYTCPVPNVNTWCVQAYELVQGALVICPSFLHRCTNTHMVYDATKPSNVEPLNRNLVNVDTYKFTKSWLDLSQETLYCLFFRIFSAFKFV